jgi:hypothetical protein
VWPHSVQDLGFSSEYGSRHVGQQSSSSSADKAGKGFTAEPDGVGVCCTGVELRRSSGRDSALFWPNFSLKGKADSLSGCLVGGDLGELALDVTVARLDVAPPIAMAVW